MEEALRLKAQRQLAIAEGRRDDYTARAQTLGEFIELLGHVRAMQTNVNWDDMTIAGATKGVFVRKGLYRDGMRAMGRPAANDPLPDFDSLIQTRCRVKVSRSEWRNQLIAEVVDDPRCDAMEIIVPEGEWTELALDSDSDSDCDSDSDSKLDVEDGILLTTKHLPPLAVAAEECDESSDSEGSEALEDTEGPQASDVKMEPVTLARPGTVLCDESSESDSEPEESCESDSETEDAGNSEAERPPPTDLPEIE